MDEEILEPTEEEVDVAEEDDVDELLGSPEIDEEVDVEVDDAGAF